MIKRNINSSRSKRVFSICGLVLATFLLLYSPHLYHQQLNSPTVTYKYMDSFEPGLIDDAAHDVSVEKTSYILSPELNSDTSSDFLLEGFFDFIKRFFDFWQNHPGLRFIILASVVAGCFYLGGAAFGGLVLSTLLDPLFGTFTKSWLGQKLRNKNPKVYDTTLHFMSFLTEIILLGALGGNIFKSPTNLFEGLSFAAGLTFEAASLIELAKKFFGLGKPDVAKEWVDGLIEADNSPITHISILLTLALLGSVGVVNYKNKSYANSAKFYDRLISVQNQHLNRDDIADFRKLYKLTNTKTGYQSKIKDLLEYFEKGQDFIDQMGYFFEVEDAIETDMEFIKGTYKTFKNLNSYERTNFKLNNENNDIYNRYIKALNDVSTEFKEKNSAYMILKTDMEHTWPDAGNLDQELLRHFAAFKENLDSTNDISSSNIFSGRNELEYAAYNKESLAIVEDLLPGLKESFDYKGLQITYNFGTENALVKDDGAIVDLQNAPYEFILYLKNKANDLGKDIKGQISEDLIKAMEGKEELNVRDLFDIVFLDITGLGKESQEKIDALYNKISQEQEDLIEDAIMEMALDFPDIFIDFNLDDILLEGGYDEYKAYEYSQMIRLFKSRNNTLSRELVDFYTKIYDTMEARFEPYFESAKADNTLDGSFKDMEAYRKAYEDYMGSFKYLTDFTLPYNLY